MDVTVEALDERVQDRDDTDGQEDELDNCEVKSGIRNVRGREAKSSSEAGKRTEETCRVVSLRHVGSDGESYDTDLDENPWFQDEDCRVKGRE